jgi:glycerate 2-kinase
MRLVAAPDKLRGTATAQDVAAALERVAAATPGWECVAQPMADGGEGTLELFGGPNRTIRVTGPLGEPVDAGWRLDDRTAVVEMARASGLDLVGGPEGNDPVAASTVGTGELLSRALELGARRLLVGLGGSATTDGGLGALRALYPLQRLRGIELIVMCDVRTGFVEAAEVFAPQKGASPAQVELLRRRLARLAEVYLEDHGVDVLALEGAGAAGGLAGGLAAAGGVLMGGFDAIADELGLPDAVEDADLVITAEGFLDEQSFEGKVVGGVAELSASLGVPCLAIVGDTVDFEAGDIVNRVESDVPNGLRVVSLVERFGRDRAEGDAVTCIEEVAAEALALGPDGLDALAGPPLR